MNLINLSEEIKNKFDIYFNILLRNSINYDEKYIIKVDIDNQQILLKPTIKDPKLIDLLKNNNTKTKLESSLLSGLKTKYPDILSVNIYIDNIITITYTLNNTPFELNDINILAKLASEYDDDNIEQLCRINTNFNKACKDPLFWWKIIEIKYPKYIIYKNRNLYDPKKVFKGLIFYINYILIDPVTNIQRLYNNYYETFRYLIFENFWIPNNSIIYGLLINIVGKKYDDFNLFLILYRVGKSFGILQNILLSNPDTGIYFIKQINNGLLTLGNSKFYDSIIVKEVLLDYISSDSIKQDNILIYQFLVDEYTEGVKYLKLEDYLEQYLSINPDNENIKNYILSIIFDIISKNRIVQYLDELINIRIYKNFETFYQKFENKLSEMDKFSLIKSVIKNNNEDNFKYLKLLGIIINS